MNNYITLTKLNEMLQQFYNEISELSLKQLSELLIQRNRDRTCYNDYAYDPCGINSANISTTLDYLKTQYLLDRMIAVGYDILGLWADIEVEEDLYYVVYEGDDFIYAFHLNTEYGTTIEFVRVCRKKSYFDVLVSNEDEVRVTLYDLLIELRTGRIHVVDESDVPFNEAEEWDDEYDEEWYED